jgi:hypothetical protein
VTKLKYLGTALIKKNGIHGKITSTLNCSGIFAAIEFKIVYIPVSSLKLKD